MKTKDELLRWEKVKNWEQRPAHQKWVHFFVLFPEYGRLLRAQRFSSILDYGCGDGALSNYLKTTFPDCEVVAYDAVEEMRRIARKSVKGITILDSLDERQFDIICMNMVLQDLDRPISILTSLKKHLSTSGVLISAIPHPVFSLIEKNHITTKRERIYCKPVHDLLRYRYEETEKVFWSSDSNNWTFLFNRTIQTYSEMFNQSGFSIRLITEPVAKCGENNSELFKIYSNTPGMMFFVCESI